MLLRRLLSAGGPRDHATGVIVMRLAATAPTTYGQCPARPPSAVGSLAVHVLSSPSTRTHELVPIALRATGHFGELGPRRMSAVALSVSRGTMRG